MSHSLKMFQKHCFSVESAADSEIIQDLLWRAKGKFAKRDEVYQVVWEFVAGMGKHLSVQSLPNLRITLVLRCFSGSLVLLVMSWNSVLKEAADTETIFSTGVGAIQGETQALLPSRWDKEIQIVPRKSTVCHPS